MKRKLLSALLILFVSFSLFAFGGEFWSISIQSSLDLNFGKKYENKRLYDSEYIDGFNNRPILQLDLSLFKGPWTFINEAIILSLRPPIVIDVDSMFTPMVRLGYLEYDDKFIYSSIGRRKQSIGISDINLFVNRDMPYYDGINLSIGKEKGFKYDALVSVSNLSWLGNPGSQWPSSPYKGYVANHDHPEEEQYNKGQHNKYFMFHSFSYEADSWYLMIGESAILANPKSIGDLNIFTNIHNENSTRANVGMEFQFAKIFKSEFMSYAMFGIDDLPALPEHSDPEMLADTPSALAFGGGVKWHIIKGDRFEYPTFDSDKGIRKNTTFGEMHGGLVISLDYAATSRWFYIRSDVHNSSTIYFKGIQSFYNYLFNPQFVTDRDHFSVPFGPKYGGDAQIISLKGSYETRRYKIDSEIEVALLGRDARDRFLDYNYWGNADISINEGDYNYSKLWITSGDIKPMLTFKANGEMGITKWLSGHAGFSLTYAPFLPFKYNINFGVTAQY